MNKLMKTIAGYGWRGLLGAFVFFLANMIAGILWPMKDELQNGASGGNEGVKLLTLLIVGFVYSLLLLYFSRNSIKSRTYRIWSYLALFYGSFTFISQLESLYFLPALTILDVESVTQIFVNNFVVTLIFVPAIVWISGPGKKVPDQGEDKGEMIVPRNQWLVLLLIPLYVGVYFFFGAFVAYSSDEVVQYYSGWAVNQSLTSHLWLFQIFRACIWIGLAWIGVSQFKRRRDAVIGITLFFGIVLSIQLIMPNPIMSGEMRLYHGVELLLSMLLYGFLCGMILTGFPRTHNDKCGNLGNGKNRR